LLVTASLGGAAVAGLSMRVVADGPANGPQPAVGVPVNRPSQGSLVICGGGTLPDSVFERFLELAGGPQAKIVFIPTATEFTDSPRANKDLDLLRAHGATMVQSLHTRDRAEANDPTFYRPLTAATGVWLAGGVQSRLAESYLNTEVERQLKALLDRGGVIGGTSAGAAIMTRVMITGGWRKATEGQGFDLLPGSVVDQHFLKRNRLGRLLGMLAAHPGLVGFGIDEGTALVVSGDNLSVVGDSYVVACLPATLDRSTQLEILRPGDQLTAPWLPATNDVAMSASPLPSREPTQELATSSSASQ